MNHIFNMNDVFRVARAWADMDGKLQEFDTERDRFHAEFVDFLTDDLQMPVYDEYTDKAQELLEKAYGPESIRLIEVIMH